MENMCVFLKTEDDLPICKMSGNTIDDKSRSLFCEKKNFSTCPVYKYYLQKYEEITLK